MTENEEQLGILFVDDEPNILSGIKRMLRSMRKDFAFFFAESGKDALEIMENNTIIILVSDMRMPGMTGDQLLSECQQRFPQTIRIMLTGQADEASVFRTVGVAHQFLAKPCEPEKLQDTLLRARASYTRMTDERLRNIVSGIGTLPSLPKIYAQLQKTLANPEATADDVAAIIEQDVAMSAKLMQLVNSSFFGLFQKVEDPARAIKLLGLETVKMLVLGVQIFDGIKVQSKLLPIETLFSHSMAVAQCSKKIALQASDDMDLINDCCLSGMMHDIGKLLLISQMSEEYEGIIMAAKADEIFLARQETLSIQTSHCDIGAYLIGLWGFNGNVVEAIAFHNSINDYPGNGFNAALAVHLADYSYYKNYPDRVLGAPPELAESYLVKLDLLEEAETWLEVADEFYQSNEE